jgi:tetrahydromethanopterin S-methyltransferase subunit B
MSRSDITTLNNTSRAAVAWAPAGYDGQTHYGAVLGAAIPAFAILLVAAAFLVQSL